MNAILGFAQIIEMSAPSPRQLKWAGEIRRAGDHLLQMIEDLLDLARIEVGKLAVRLEAVDVSTVVSEAVAIVQPLVAARRIVLDVEPGTGIDTQVDADRLRLRQVLVNLLSNAAKYNREAGTITLRCRPHDGKLRLSVADTGNGIAPERLHGLFQPFERLGAETGPVEGTGIGLALCKQLAEMMGAEIGVDSRVGVGSTFWIDLRRAGARPAAPGTGAGAIEGRGPPACELLVIEDNAANAEVLAAFLAPYPDVHVRIAPDGEAGLALAAQSAPDIVLVDIRLPGIDGYEVLRRLRADPRLADTGIAAVSADAMPGDVGRGLAAGFDAYLAKPVDRRELLGLIKRLLASRLRPAP
jgi:CheY-like chemotaxis protein/anti-sigma regulatory factor (Ser/Thr protein kinase)